MDDLFDSGNGNVYYQVRDEIFPEDKRGSAQFWNRAGDKLWQVHEIIGLFDGITETHFFDICGGPGSFSQVLLKQSPGAPRVRGYGITLMHSLKDSWYTQLQNDKRFKIFCGEDGSGNVYVPENLIQVEKGLENEKINLVVADGGFGIMKNAEGQHVENLQELYSGRIILSEFLLMMKILQPKGHFVCKLYDIFSDLTASIIYMAAQMFEEIYIVKPRRSRSVNSERYFVGKYFLEKDEIFYTLYQMLDTLHKRCELGKIPNSVFPIEIVRKDEPFVTSLREANEFICRKQADTVQLVMNGVERRMMMSPTTQQPHPHPQPQHQPHHNNHNHGHRHHQPQNSYNNNNPRKGGGRQQHNNTNHNNNNNKLH
jgi:cap1 methyltransferase